MELADIRALAARGYLLRALREALDVAESADRPAGDRMDALLVACRCAAGRGLHRDAHQYARRALELAQTEGDTYRTALAHLYAGRAWLEAGDPLEAERSLLEFLALLPRVPELEGHRATAIYHLAMAYERSRRTEAAVESYRKAAELYERGGLRTEASKARRNAAWLLLRTGDTEGAEEHLTHARILTTGAGAVEKANQIIMESYLHYVCGRTDDAMAGAEEILTPGCPGATAWSRCLAAWIATSVTLEAEPRHAPALLELALREMAACQDTALMNMVIELRRRVEGML